MPIIPAGFAQINLRFTGSAAPNGAEVTFGLDTGDVLAQDPTVIANAVADEWSPTVMVQLTNQLIFSEVYCKFGPNDTGESGSAFRNVAGSGQGASTPPNVAILVRKNTGGGGRRGRGRMYIPGMDEAHVGPGGVLTAAGLNAVQVAMNAFFTGLTGDGLIPHVLHSPGISPVPAPTPILSFEVQSLVATQRDRLR